MKATIPLILSLVFSGVQGVQSSEFNAQLSAAESDFARLGPSLEVLNIYDELLRHVPDEPELSTTVAKAWNKKAIIGLGLGKETSAIQDFERSLTLNPYNTAVKKNLLDLLVKYGHRDKLVEMSKILDEKDTLYIEALNQLNTIDELANTNDVEKITEAVNMSPLDHKLREKRIQLTTTAIKTSKDTSEQSNLFADLVDDLNVLIKINPAVNAENWNKLSQIYLFGLGEFSNALNANKKCLHFDMDNSQCKKNSKFLNKYSDILTQLSQHHQYYALLQEANDESMELEEIDIKDLSNALENPYKFLKIRRENEPFSTNMEFIQSKAASFNSQFNLKVNKLEMTAYTTLAMNALLFHDSKAWKLYSSRLPQSSFPKSLNAIDKALSSKDFPQAQQLISQLPKNMQKCSFIQQRNKKIQAHKHQQQQQQQQQQQRRQNQQQHQQQRRPAKPKNDYYAILEVSRDADERQIKKAYREATKRYHPDKYRGEMSNEDVENKMAQINMAYEVLSDPKLKKDYDTMGIDPNDSESQQQQQQHQQQYQQQQHHQNSFGQQFRSGHSFNFGGFQFGGMNGRRG